MMRRKTKSLSQTSSFYNYGYRDYSPQTVRFTEYRYSPDGRSVEVVETTDSEGNMWVATSDINKIYTYETNKKNK